jgi:1,2-diacylglycerol 3-beta-glucosyltransferase
MGYLMHWFVVIPWVALKMALLPKRLIWAKTAHGAAGVAEQEEDLLVGALEESLDSDGIAPLAAEGP